MKKDKEMKEDHKDMKNKKGKKKAPKKDAKKKKSSAGGGWIAHVKKVAKQKKISYKEALKVASKSYKKK